jgi:hypothetical protein
VASPSHDQVQNDHDKNGHADESEQLAEVIVTEVPDDVARLRTDAHGRTCDRFHLPPHSVTTVH